MKGINVTNIFVTLPSKNTQLRQKEHTTMKKYFHLLLVLVLLTIGCLPTHAVLKEKNLEKTLYVLRNELTTYHNELELQSDFMASQQALVRQELMDVMNKSQQNSLMLYSQKSGYLFDLTYACHQAIGQYKDFKYNAAPFREYIRNTDVEISRYDSLINDLSNMYVQTLTPKAQTDRNVCLTLAINIRRTLNDNRLQMEQYVSLYDATEKHLKGINDYANKRYNEIQSSIFSNSGNTYFNTLRNLRNSLREAKETFNDKYTPNFKVGSEWDGGVIIGLLIGLVVIWIIVGIVNFVVVGIAFTWLVKHDKLKSALGLFMSNDNIQRAKDVFTEKRPYIILATTVVSLAILLGLMRIGASQNFLVMASGLMVEFIWLLGVILLSLLIRLTGKQMKSGFRIYLPLIFIGLIVIIFRIVLIPNDLVELLFPPILIICAIWQWIIAAHHRKHLPRTDMFYSFMSLVVFAVSVVASWTGYVLLSVQLLIWWIMQLTCILTITCIVEMLRGFGHAASRKYFSAETPIGKVWFFRFVYYAIMPILGTGSIILSIYWAAAVFNLSDTLWRLLATRLIDTSNFTLSIMSVVIVVSLYFIFAYIYHTATDVLFSHFQRVEHIRAQEEDRPADEHIAARRLAMWKNVLQVVVWGVWVLTAMAIFHINNSWIVAISAGLSTGIGFAMKDILENIYYGISLMAGHIRVGDYISIDGTRGTVKSISYVSTTLETLDGSIVNFQNSQLFTKNYKNLTRNHGNELAIIPIGVAYGTKVPDVKDAIEKAVRPLERENYITYINTVFAGFGDNSVDFKILAWVDSRKQTYAKSDIMEAVYNELNARQIEIPFPQRDLHIISSSNDANATADATDHGVQFASSLSEAKEIIEKEQKEKNSTQSLG